MVELPEQTRNALEQARDSLLPHVGTSREASAVALVIRALLLDLDPTKHANLVRICEIQARIAEFGPEAVDPDLADRSDDEQE